MIRLIDILKGQGVALGHYKIHLATAGSTSPLEAYLQGEFKQWQEEQNAKNFECETVIGLIHRGGDRWLSQPKRGRQGRPAIAAEIRQLILRTATANPLWRAPRIHGELTMLGWRQTSHWEGPEVGALLLLLFLKDMSCALIRAPTLRKVPRRIRFPLSVEGFRRSPTNDKTTGPKFGGSLAMALRHMTERRKLPGFGPNGSLSTIQSTRLSLSAGSGADLIMTCVPIRLMFFTRSPLLKISDDFGWCLRS